VRVDGFTIHPPFAGRYPRMARCILMSITQSWRNSLKQRRTLGSLLRGSLQGENFPLNPLESSSYTPRIQVLPVRAPGLHPSSVCHTKTFRYRLLRSFFNRTTCWVNFDPFFAQKEEMFKNSAAGIHRQDMFITSWTLV